MRSDPALVSLSQTMATFSPEKESCSGDRKSGIVWLVCSITYTLTRLLGSHCLLLPHMTFPIPILFLTSPTFWIRSENQKLQQQKKQEVGTKLALPKSLFLGSPLDSLLGVRGEPVDKENSHKCSLMQLYTLISQHKIHKETHLAGSSSHIKFLSSKHSRK